MPPWSDLVRCFAGCDVLFTVGQEDDDFGVGEAGSQHLCRARDRGADTCHVLGAVCLDVVDASEEVRERRLVERQWANQIRVPREAQQADAIVWPARRETRRGLLRQVESRQLRIHVVGGHRRRHVEAQQDIDALGRAWQRHAVRRARQGDDDAEQAEDLQHAW